MKDTQKTLEDIDFVTELSRSELEQINGGAGKLSTLSQEIDPEPTTNPTPSANAVPAEELPPTYSLKQTHTSYLKL